MLLHAFTGASNDVFEQPSAPDSARFPKSRLPAPAGGHPSRTPVTNWRPRHLSRVLRRVQIAGVWLRYSSILWWKDGSKGVVGPLWFLRRRRTPSGSTMTVLRLIPCHGRMAGVWFTLVRRKHDCHGSSTGGPSTVIIAKNHSCGDPSCAVLGATLAQLKWTGQGALVTHYLNKIHRSILTARSPRRGCNSKKHFLAYILPA